MLDYIANKTSRKMTLYLNWDEVEEAKFCLGMKVLIHDLTMTMGIALLAYWAGLFIESCIMFAAFGFLRLKAGGYHCKESWQCFLCTSSIVVGGAVLAQNLGYMSTGQIVAAYLILCVIAGLIAPQGTKIRPIPLDMQRKRKWETAVTLFVYMVLSVLLKETAGNLLLAASVFEIVTLVPSVIVSCVEIQ